MRILYLTDGFPYPLTSGLLRQYHFIRELSRRHELTLLSLVERGVAPEHMQAVQAITQDTTTFTFAPKPASFKTRVIRRLLGMNPYDSAVAEMSATVARLHREQPFDAVVFSGIRTTPILRQVADIPVIADLCDSSWVRIRSRLPNIPLKGWPMALMYHFHVASVEQHLLHRSTHALLAAPRDREAMGRWAAPKTSVVPNGIDLEYWRRSSTARGLDTIVLTGAMHFRPNVDAARYLIDQILPLVRREIPDVRLLIVGRDPAPALKAAAQQPGITLTGSVPDMRPYLEQSTVFAAPIRFGAGIQNKVLEAMAMALPVVASPIAYDGLRTEAGDTPPMALGRDAEEFARELVKELQSARRDPAPRNNVRCYVERHFPWSASGDTLERVLGQITGNPRLAS